MDPVTERLLERTRARREQLAKKMTESNLSPRKRRAPLAESNSQEEEDTITSTSPVKTSRQVSMEIKPDTPAISSVKSRMQHLAQQRAVWAGKDGQELDSPKNVSAPRHHVSSPDPVVAAPVPPSRKSRFAALAANINNWEDDTNHPLHKKEEEKRPVRVWQPPKPREEPAPSQPIPAKRTTIQTTPNTTQNTIPKQAPAQTTSCTYQPPSVTLSQPMPATRSPVKARTQESKEEETKVPLRSARAHIRAIPNDSPQPSPRSASNKTVNFYGEKVTLQPVAATSKANSTPVTVGVPRQMATAPKQSTTPTKKQAPRLTHEVRAQYSTTSRERTCSEVKKVSAHKQAAVLSPTKTEPRIGALAMTIQQRLKQHEKNWQSNDINKKIQEERKKEMEALRMRWEYPRPRPPTPPVEEEEEEEENSPQPLPRTKQHISLPEEEPEIVEEKQEVEEQILPAEEMEEEMMEDNQYEEEEEEEEEEEAEDDDDDQGDMNITDVLGDIDDLIDEAEAQIQQEKQKSDEEVKEAEKRKWQEEEEQSPTSSARFMEPEEPTEELSPPPTKVPRSASSDSVSSDDSNQSLMYSIDGYRSQRTGKNQPTNVKKIVREEEVRSPVREVPMQQEQHSVYDTPRAKPQVCPKQKIKRLMEEVSAQQSIIHQTTQALNLIASNAEYKGSMEEVEAERLLLLATQRRHACLNEIQRLKNPQAKQGVLRTSEGEEIVPCSGSITIQDIRLPLKTEYVLNQGSRDRTCHYYLVLLRQRENVIATQMLSTVDGLSGDCLPFTNMIALNDIDSDFVIEVGIFEMHVKRNKMEASMENKSKSNFLNALTPKKLKSMKHHSKMPHTSSPGGPGAVRTSAFTLVGTSRLSLASSKVGRFTLSKVPFNSPLEGSLHLKLTCRTKSNLTFRGWLTMFDDISGYGAWHRRWCVLNNGFISYWTFPDQEKIKPPIDSIDLHTSNTEEVAPISRILCARPNTFEVVTCRPASKHDKETLVTKSNASITSTTHRLSADTKEERVEWIDALNTVLLDIRTWKKDPRLH